jgi:hypothetical protein
MGGIYMMYLMAFLDDSSCFIAERPGLAGKGSDTWPTVFLETFQLSIHACILGSDTKGKFAGGALINLCPEHDVTICKRASHMHDQSILQYATDSPNLGNGTGTGAMVTSIIWRALNSVMEAMILSFLKFRINKMMYHLFSVEILS